MRALEYALRHGWVGLWRTRGASGFAILAIALALVVLGALLLVTWNAQRVLGRFSDSAEFSVYLRDDASSEQRGEIEATLDGSGLTAARDYVSKPEAQMRFRSSNPDLAALADSLDANPFPASIEVRVRAGAADGERLDALIDEVRGLAGVEDVRYDREWLTRLSAGLQALGGVGLALAVMMGLAAAATVAAVVRLGLQARLDEIEIMELVGAPLAFIRGPLVAEGVLQGGLGAAAALLALGVGFAFARQWWGEALSAALAGMPPEFLPLRFCAVLVAGGMIVGAAGGLAAARHAGVAAETRR
jgi:cell division transport system permease protein